MRRSAPVLRARSGEGRQPSAALHAWRRSFAHCRRASQPKRLLARRHASDQARLRLLMMFQLPSALRFLVLLVQGSAVASLAMMRRVQPRRRALLSAWSSELDLSFAACRSLVVLRACSIENAFRAVQNSAKFRRTAAQLCQNLRPPRVVPGVPRSAAVTSRTTTHLTSARSCCCPGSCGSARDNKCHVRCHRSPSRPPDL